MGSEEGVYEEGVNLIDWSAPAYLLCGQTRQIVLEDDRSVQVLHHKVWLNRGFKSDLQWWACFLPAWNGRGMMNNMVKGNRKWC